MIRTFAKNFKKGDKVKIIDKLHGHGFDIGDIVTILHIGGSQGDEYYDAKDQFGEIWSIEDSEIEKYTPHTREEIRKAVKSVLGSSESRVKSKRSKGFVDEVGNSAIITIKSKTMRISRSRALALIQGSKGHFLTVEFIRKDGTLRKLNGQYSKNIQPNLGLGLICLRESVKAKETPKDSLRQFNIGSLKSLKLGGVLYKIRN